jgi:hypothetical protein
MPTDVLAEVISNLIGFLPHVDTSHRPVVEQLDPEPPILFDVVTTGGFTVRAYARGDSALSFIGAFSPDRARERKFAKQMGTKPSPLREGDFTVRQGYILTPDDPEFLEILTGLRDPYDLRIHQIGFVHPPRETLEARLLPTLSESARTAYLAHRV